MMTSPRAVVIGAGIGGLASAALLARRGYAVTVLEKNSQPGGRAMVWKHRGYTFDMGPSWYQVPEAFERFFGHFGKTPADYYKLIKLDPQYRFFALDNEGRANPQNIYDIAPDFEANIALFERLEPGSSQRVKAFLADAKVQYETAKEHVLYKNMGLLDYINPMTALQLARMNLRENLETTVKHYVSHPHLQKMLLYTVLFIGSAPKALPGMFSMMAYIDVELGTWYPMGGMGRVVEALVRLGEEQGVRYCFNEPVIGFEVKNGLATGVKTPNNIHAADIVLGNADLPFIETQLLPPRYQSYPEAYWKKKTMAPSAFVAYLGVNKRLKHLRHHNLIVTDNWDRHFTDLFGVKTLPKSPTYYVSCPSKTDSSVAPPGRENLFIAVQIPSGIRLSEKERQAYLSTLLKQLEMVAGESILDHIELWRIFSDSDFGTTFNAYNYTAIGLSTTFLQTLLRPAHRSKKIQNLYYAGQYTAPGVGVPLCLIAAERAVNLVPPAQVSRYKKWHIPRLAQTLPEPHSPCRPPRANPCLVSV